MRIGFVVLVFLALATPALAQEDGGPVVAKIPKVNGLSMKHVFTVMGVTGYGDLHTVFMCTSLEKSKEVTVAIEVWDYDGVLLNDVTQDNGVDTIDPGESTTMETEDSDDDVAAFDEDEEIELSDDANHGTARILASSTKLACTALIADKVGDPPASMVNLHVIAKKKQKGD